MHRQLASSALAMALYAVLATAGLADECTSLERGRDARFELGHELTFLPVVALGSKGEAGYRTVEPMPGPSELHVISSYEGSGTVILGPNAKQVTLVLTSYEASRWQVQLLEGATLTRVLTLGVGEQRVTGLPDDLRVEHHSPAAYGPVWRREIGNTSYMPLDFKAFISGVRCATGLTESSFQYAYGLGRTFEVPPAAPADAKAVVAAGSPRVDPPLNAAAQLRSYDRQIAGMPVEMQSTGRLILELMTRGALPAFTPRPPRTEDASAPVDLMPVGFPSADRTHRLVEGDRECAQAANAVVGTGGPDTIECSWGGQWYALGPGGDVVSDGWDNDVFISGSGDDIFDGGWDSDMFVFHAGWGNDIVDKTCHNQSMSEDDRKRLGWNHPFQSFFVFGQGIEPESFAWRDGTVLEYLPTGDTITVKRDCISFVFYEEGQLQPRPQG